MDYHTLDATSIGSVVFIVGIMACAIALFTFAAKIWGNEKGERIGERVLVALSALALCRIVYVLFIN